MNYGSHLCLCDIRTQWYPEKQGISLFIIFFTNTGIWKKIKKGRQDLLVWTSCLSVQSSWLQTERTFKQGHKIVTDYRHGNRQIETVTVWDSKNFFQFFVGNLVKIVGRKFFLLWLSIMLPFLKTVQDKKGRWVFKQCENLATHKFYILEIKVAVKGNSFKIVNKWTGYTFVHRVAPVLL